MRQREQMASFLPSFLTKKVMITARDEHESCSDDRLGFLAVYGSLNDRSPRPGPHKGPWRMQIWLGES